LGLHYQNTLFAMVDSGHVPGTGKQSGISGISNRTCVLASTVFAQVNCGTRRRRKTRRWAISGSVPTEVAACALLTRFRIACADRKPAHIAPLGAHAISRWRQPPGTPAALHPSPVRGDRAARPICCNEIASVAPDGASGRKLQRVRWLAPPANLDRPKGR
jgi:hypothetical protein